MYHYKVRYTSQYCNNHNKTTQPKEVHITQSLLSLSCSTLIGILPEGLQNQLENLHNSKEVRRLKLDSSFLHANRACFERQKVQAHVPQEGNLKQ